MASTGQASKASLQIFSSESFFGWLETKARPSFSSIEKKPGASIVQASQAIQFSSTVKVFILKSESFN